MARDWNPQNRESEVSERSSIPDGVGRGIGRTPRSAEPALGRDDLRRPSRHSPSPSPDVPFPNRRDVLYERDRGYRLTQREIQVIVEVGKFRVLDENDLARELSPKADAEHRNSIDSLVRKGLVRRGTFEGPEGSPRHLITLTKRGHRLLRANRLVAEGQATYSDFVKPREANHDADLYPLYLKETARIEANGGRVRRVTLDFELKRKINHDIARLGAEARPEIAERYGLTVVDNKIPLPDLQLEYERADGTIERINLELVSEHYRARQIGQKAKARFVMYALRGEGGNLRRILDQQELTAEIFAL